MSWDYAELSKLAKKNGGPEKLVELLVKSGEQKVLPWVGVALAGGIALTIGVRKIIEYFSQKIAISDVEVELAKKELIQGIKDYDAAQATTDNEINVRMAQLEDIVQISLVLATSWKTAFRGIVDSDYLDALRDDHWVDFLTNGLNGDAVFSMVLLDNQDIVGASILSKSEMQGEVHMKSLYLLPDKIGRGYGHKFYCEIEYYIKCKGYVKCVLDVLTNNKRAISFYNAHGFTDTGIEETTVLGNLKYPYRVFVKELI